MNGDGSGGGRGEAASWGVKRGRGGVSLHRHGHGDKTGGRRVWITHRRVDANADGSASECGSSAGHGSAAAG